LPAAATVEQLAMSSGEHGLEAGDVPPGGPRMKAVDDGLCRDDASDAPEEDTTEQYLRPGVRLFRGLGGPRLLDLGDRALFSKLAAHQRTLVMVLLYALKEDAQELRITWGVSETAEPWQSMTMLSKGDWSAIVPPPAGFLPLIADELAFGACHPIGWPYPAISSDPASIAARRPQRRNLGGVFRVRVEDWSGAFAFALQEDVDRGSVIILLSALAETPRLARRAWERLTRRFSNRPDTERTPEPAPDAAEG
jgi:hypothetical protein